jgi:hypothetical protein
MKAVFLRIDNTMVKKIKGRGENNGPQRAIRSFPLSNNPHRQFLGVGQGII